MIKVYHGSDVIVEKPEVKRGRANADFGVGFYVTESYEMAEKWASHKVPAVINEYDLDIDKLNTYNFNLDPEWLDFVVANRRIKADGYDFTNYDILRGPTADDKMFSTIEQYENGFISQETAVKALTTMKIGTQLSITNQEAIDNCLQFTGATTLSPERREKVLKQNKKEHKAANDLTEKIIRDSHKQSQTTRYITSNIEEQSSDIIKTR